MRGDANILEYIGTNPELLVALAPVGRRVNSGHHSGATGPERTTQAD